MARRRRVSEERDNHERWLVSYADFITLLFAFFVVMYSLSTINEGKYRILSDSLVQAFRSVNIDSTGREVILESVPPIAVVAPLVTAPQPQPTPSPERQEVTRRMHNMADEIRRVLEPLARGGQVRVSEGAHGITVEINASVLFSPGDAAIGGNAGGALRAVAEVLADSDFPITIEGHTDSLPINTFRFPSNWELSSSRASSVVRLFIDAGVVATRLTAAGYADQRPVSDNLTEEGRSRNRRVTILIESMIAEADPPPVLPLQRDDPLGSIFGGQVEMQPEQRSPPEESSPQ